MWAFSLLLILSGIIFIFEKHWGVFLGLEVIMLGAFFFRNSKNLIDIKQEHILPPVSIIIPMRNEERNVKSCILSLTGLTYPRMEVLIVNDSSTDRTQELIREELTKISEHTIQNFRFLNAPPLPPGWGSGKIWAMEYALQHAKHELIVVSDADVQHSPESLKNSVSHFLNTQADFMSRFPYAIISGFGEWPLIFFIFILRLASWFSITLLKRPESLPLSTYVMFTKKLYYEVNGNTTIKFYVPEALAIADVLAKLKKKVVILDDDRREITMRMYRGFIETTRGLIRITDVRIINPYSFIGAFIGITFAIDGPAKLFQAFTKGDEKLFFAGVLSYLCFSALFWIYAHLSYQQRWSAPIAPFLGVFFVCITVAAIMRDAIGLPIQWKGRFLNTTKE